MDLIAQEPPIFVETHLIDSFNGIKTCKRGPKEDLNCFVAKYRGLAAEHLMRAGTNHSSQLGGVFAITLLNNATLTEASLTNAKLRLITMAEEDAKNEDGDEKKVMLKHSECILFLQLLSQFRNIIKPSNNKGKRLNARAIYTGYNNIVEAICPMVRQREESNDAAGIAKAIACPSGRCMLNVNDAVAVLGSLTQTSPKVDD